MRDRFTQSTREFQSLKNEVIEDSVESPQLLVTNLGIQNYTPEQKEILSSELYQNAIDLLVTEWEKTQNYNAFLLAQLVTQNPTFLSMQIMRGLNPKDFNKMKIPLWNRFCNKLMGYNRKSGGKKLKMERLLTDALKEREGAKYPSLILFKALLMSVPNQDIRRIPHGSGFLTKAVDLTISKKISWFLKTIVDPLYRSKKSFKQKLNIVLDQIFASSTKSVVLKKKKEAQLSASKANLS